MSEVGHQPTCRFGNPTSVLPPTPDIPDPAGHVDFGPMREIVQIVSHAATCDS